MQQKKIQACRRKKIRSWTKGYVHRMMYNLPSGNWNLSHSELFPSYKTCCCFSKCAEVCKSPITEELECTGTPLLWSWFNTVLYCYQ